MMELMRRAVALILATAVSMSQPGARAALESANDSKQEAALSEKQGDQDNKAAGTQAEAPAESKEEAMVTEESLRALVRELVEEALDQREGAQAESTPRGRGADSSEADSADASLSESWAESSRALEEILAYVDGALDEGAETFVPAAERVAVFDLDGTLLAEDFPGPFVNQVFLHRVQEDKDYKAPKEVREYAASLQAALEEGSVTEEMFEEYRRFYPKVFAGMTVGEYMDHVRAFKKMEVPGHAGMTYGEAFFRPMVDLVRYLADRDFAVYLCSAADRYAVRAMIEGVLDDAIPPERVIGSDLVLAASGQGTREAGEYQLQPEDAVVLADEPMGAANMNMNKVLSIVREIGRVPVLVFGNSTIDLSMAQYVGSNEEHPGRGFLLLGDDELRYQGDLAAADELEERCAKLSLGTISMRDDFAMIYGEDVVREGEAAGHEDGGSSKAARAYLGQGKVGGSWTANLFGAFQKDMEVSERDDFFSASNLEYLSGLEPKPGETTAGVFDDAEQIMEERAIGLLKDKSQKGHDAALVQAMYGLATDWKARDAAGVDDFARAAEEIEAIGDMDGLSAYLTAGDPTHESIFSFDVDNSLIHPGTNEVSVKATDLLLGDAAEYGKLTENGTRVAKYHEGIVSYMLTRLGKSEAEVGRVLDGCRSFESAIAESMLTMEEIYADDYFERIMNPRTLAQLKREEGGLPLTGALRSMGWNRPGTYNLEQPDWLAALDKLYVADHLENIKSYLLAHLAVTMIGLSDRDAYDHQQELMNERYGSSGSRSEEEIGLDYVDSYLSEPMDYVYIDNYCSKEERDAVLALIGEFKDHYHKMLESETWLSEETRKKAVEKLDSIRVKALYPDTRVDYSELEIKGPGEGGSLAEARREIIEFWVDEAAARVGEPVDPERWSMSIRAVNAYYSVLDNSINILAGGAAGICSVEQDRAVVLATLGAATIGHELSHAFDTSGAQFDKDGNYADWWTKKDKEAFEERTKKLVAYLGEIVPFEGSGAVNGELVKTEMIADMGGMEAALAIAAQEKDFDYKTFFESYALAWSELTTREQEIEQLASDPHPLNHLRANITVQQCQEFLDAFGVKEGDGMYLAPEDRVTVW